MESKKIIIVQKESFDIEDFILELKNDSNSVGGVVSFIGYVRDFLCSDKTSSINNLFLEHYPGMTEKALNKIASMALRKWPIINLGIIHRYGLLKAGEPIVAVVVLSEHRDQAFDACKFIIDYLKTEAPFWKKEVSNNYANWVEQKESDLIKIK